LFGTLERIVGIIVSLFTFERKLMFLNILVCCCVAAACYLGYLIWSLQKIIDSNDKMIKEIRNNIDSFDRSFLTVDNNIYQHSSMIRKEVYNTLSIMNKDIKNLELKINEVNKQMNGIQGNINLLKPVLSYIRAKEAADKSAVTHAHNTKRVAELKKEATNTLK